MTNILFLLCYSLHKMQQSSGSKTYLGTLSHISVKMCYALNSGCSSSKRCAKSHHSILLTRKAISRSYYLMWTMSAPHWAGTLWVCTVMMLDLPGPNARPGLPAFFLPHLDVRRWPASQTLILLGLSGRSFLWGSFHSVHMPSRWNHNG